MGNRRASAAESRGRLGTTVSLAWRRMRLGSRGMQFTERAESSVPPRDLSRIDACWALGHGLGGADLLGGAAWQARHLMLALEAGEPYRIARALAWEAMIEALEGAGERAEELAGSAEALAERIENPHALAWAVSAGAAVAFAAAEWRRATTMCELALALFRERCADIAWETASSRVASSSSRSSGRSLTSPPAPRARSCRSARRNPLVASSSRR